MSVATNLAVLTLLGTLIILAVRFLLVPGIERCSLVLNLSSKARGQLLGYATSTPELAIVIASAASGVFDAGFWNIASSNIINWLLFMSAVVFYRKSRDLLKKPFRDELLFGLLSVGLPLVLYGLKVQNSVMLGSGLVLVFIVYKALDRKLNRGASVGEEKKESGGNLGLGVLGVSVGILIIVAAGWTLGGIAQVLVDELNIAAWVIGWLLGFVSSIPEMSGFVEVYRKHKRKGTLGGIDDTQEALDALVASNMCNLGVVLPVGIFIVALL